MQIKYYLGIAMLLLLSGCGAYYNQPTGIERASIGEITPATTLLRELPKPKEPIVVGIYKFRDQTGQYKADKTLDPALLAANSVIASTILNSDASLTKR